MFRLIKFLFFGCLFVVILVAIGVGFGFYGLGSWFEKETKTVGNLLGMGGSDYAKKVEELKKEYPFTAPADNRVSEDQLVRFLNVRRAVFRVWKEHEAEFKKVEAEKEPGTSGPMKTLEIFNEIRMAHASALADQRMSPDEYKYLAQMIYTTWATSTTKDLLKNKSVREIGREQLQKQIENLDRQIRDPNTNPDVRKQLQALRDQLEEQRDRLDTELQKADEALNSIPEENIALFKKHEAEIREYSMGGLEIFGI